MPAHRTPRPNLRSAARGVLVGTLFAAASIASGIAWAATPVPPFPEDNVAVAGVDDVFDPLREFLESFESSVGADYYVCVVRISDPAGRKGNQFAGSAMRYVELVQAEWARELPPQSSVIIAIAIDNGGIAVHSGSDWTRLGFEPMAIQQTIEASGFSSFVRSGDYNGAVQALINTIDVELLQREEQWVALRHQVDADMPALRVEIQNLFVDVDALADPPEKATARLDEATRKLDEAQLLLAAERFANAKEKTQDVRAIVDDVGDLLDEAAAAQQFRTRSLPIYFGLAFLTLGFAGLFYYLRVRKRSAQHAQDMLETWERDVAQANARLTALEDANPFLFGESSHLLELYGGKTAKAIRALGRAVDRLFARYASAKALVDSAREQFNSAGALAIRPFEAIIDSLTTRKHTVGAELEDHAFFLDDLDKATVTGRELLETLLQGYEEIAAKVGRLEREVLATLAEAQDISAMLAAAAAEISDLEAQAADATHYRDQLGALLNTAVETLPAAERDPIAHHAAVLDLRGDAEALLEQLHLALEAATSGTSNLVREASDVAARVTAHRADDGMLLLEPGFEPDAALEDVEEMRADVFALIAAGDASAAVVCARQAVDVMRTLEQRLASAVEARENASAWIAAERARLATLEQRLPDSLAQLEALGASHALSALQQVKEGTEHGALAVAFAKRCLDEAEGFCAEKSQRYLGAAELVRRARRTLDQVEALLDDVARTPAALEEAQQEARSALQEATALAGEIATLRAEDREATFLSASTVSSMMMFQAGLDEERAAPQADGADWFARAWTASWLRELAKALVDQASTERQAKGAAQDAVDEVGARVAEVERLVAESNDDRDRPGMILSRAKQRLDAVTAELAAARPDWIDVREHLAVVDELVGEVQASTELFVSLAREAREAIAAATRRRRQVALDIEFGKFADLGDCDRLLLASRAHLAVADYGAAVVSATQAERAADATADTARHEAAWSRWQNLVGNGHAHDGREPMRRAGRMWSGWSAGESIAWTEADARLFAISAFGSSSTRVVAEWTREAADEA